MTQPRRSRWDVVHDPNAPGSKPSRFSDVKTDDGSI